MSGACFEISCSHFPEEQYRTYFVLHVLVVPQLRYFKHIYHMQHDAMQLKMLKMILSVLCQGVVHLSDFLTADILYSPCQRSEELYFHMFIHIS
jgi:hypothetical protein